MTLKIESSRLKLRELTQADHEWVHQLHSLPETDRYNTLGIPKDEAETKTLVKTWLAAAADDPRMKYVLCIEDAEGRFIGLLGINIGRANYKSAEIWYKLLPAFWSHGFATEAVKAVLKYCFKTMQLHRVEAGCAVENVASAKVLEKAGMIYEGKKRSILPIRGAWHDGFIFAILEEDYFNASPL